jgi:hypothetical protein
MTHCISTNMSGCLVGNDDYGNSDHEFGGF